MPSFHYEARRPEGEEISGVLEAKNRGHAMVLLRQHGLLVDLLKESGEYERERARGAARAGRAGWGQGPFYPLWPIRASVLANFFDQLGRLLSAGVTPHEAFAGLDERLSGRLRRVARDGASSLAQGGSLSDHLRKYPRFFPPHIIGIMRAGELSGSLGDACQEITHQFETDWTQYKRMLVIRLYVGMHILACILIAPFPYAMARAVPAQMDAVSGSTETVLDIDGESGPQLNVSKSAAWEALKPGLGEYLNTLVHDILPWLLGAFVLWMVLKVVLNLPAIVSVRDWLALNVPVAAGATKRAAVARFTRTFELMQRAALPLGDCVREAAQATGNSLVARRVAAPATTLGQGGKLTDALDAARIFGPMDISLIATAEVSGTLEDALGTLSEKTRTSREDYLKITSRGGCVVGMLLSALLVAFAMYIGYVGIFSMYESMFDWMME